MKMYLQNNLILKFFENIPKNNLKNKKFSEMKK